MDHIIAGTLADGETIGHLTLLDAPYPHKPVFIVMRILCANEFFHLLQNRFSESAVRLYARKVSATIRQEQRTTDTYVEELRATEANIIMNMPRAERRGQCKRRRSGENERSEMQELHDELGI